jgi:hypothetical protein
VKEKKAASIEAAFVFQQEQKPSAAPLLDSRIIRRRAPNPLSKR